MPTKNYRKFYLAALALVLTAMIFLILNGCGHKNVTFMPKQTMGAASPTESSVNSNQKSRENNMDDTKLTAVSQGNWGANGIIFVVEESGVKIEYDCADGEIKNKLMINEKGEFKAEGSHTPGTFGPIREDNPPKPKPAHYEGKVSGETMTLAVTLTETKEKIADYTLERGKTPRLHKCQ